MIFSKAASALLLTASSWSSLPTSTLAAVDPASAPNIIIMQPDDLQFYEGWTPPAHVRSTGGWQYPFDSDFPHMNYLRDHGAQMTRAYTASPKCTTSRYSTMTGRYPSRSAFSRIHGDNAGTAVSNVAIPTTKLHDEPALDGQDCSKSNLAALFKANNYTTGVVGKWHLHSISRRMSYPDIQNVIEGCGFDSAEAIYRDNLNGNWVSGFHHNMEYVASRAVKFIEDAPTSPRQPFFLYVNPTVPHGPSVHEALVNYTCTQTPEGDLADPNDPVFSVHGMTALHNGDCVAYRQSVLDRAGTSREDADLGGIWADDAVGAIIDALDRKGELENTFFLYQQDHGQEAKDTIWEQGMRIAQFVHFPNGGFSSEALSTGFNGVVSTVDIGPTAMDYAGILPGDAGTYSFDGSSWRSAIEAGTDFGSEDKCIMGELDRDRTVICGCHKYMRLYDISDPSSSGTVNMGNMNSYNLDMAEEMFFDWCKTHGDASSYATGSDANPEETNLLSSSPVRSSQLSAVLDCHLAKTDPTLTSDPLYAPCETSPAPPTPSPTTSPTSSPTELDTTDPVLLSMTPGVAGTHLGDVASYTFSAEVTDDSTFNFVRFQFRREDTRNAVGTGLVDATFDAASGMYSANFDFAGEKGELQWRVNARDREGNTLRSPWVTFVVGLDAETVVTIIKNEIEQLIAAEPTLAPKFVRMGFHDAVGGVDGCIDMTNDDNAGLNIPIAALDPVVVAWEKQDVNGEISRADIWAIAALVACEVSLPGMMQGQGRFPLNYVGRQNCEDRSDACDGGNGICDASNGPHRALPGSNFKTHEVLDYFNSVFGFTTEETVALMGAHTLGGCSRENSGYEGNWTRDELSLNNAYYSSIVGGDGIDDTEEELMDAIMWSKEFIDNSAIGTPDRWQWFEAGNGVKTIMINADIALVRDLSDQNTDGKNYLETTGEPTCHFKDLGMVTDPVCPAAKQTLSLMGVYAHDNDKWVDDFESVMEKMMTSGYSTTAACSDPVCVLGSVSSSRRLRGGE